MKKINRRIKQTIFFGLVAGVVALISTPVKGQLSPLIEAPHLNQREHFTRNVQDLLVQSPVPSTPTQTPPQTQVVPVTQVKLVPTKTGIQVILTTPIQAQEEILTVPAMGNESLLWIKNTRLQLPNALEFHIQNPHPGIRDVYVTQLDDVTEALGQTEKALQVVAQYNARVAEFKARMGERLKQTRISVVNFHPGVIMVRPKSAFSGAILEELGLDRPRLQKLNPTAITKLSGIPGMYTISPELMTLIDADVLFVLNPGFPTPVDSLS